MSRMLVLAAAVGLVMATMTSFAAAAKDCDAICKSRCPTGGMTSGGGGGAACIARCMGICRSGK